MFRGDALSGILILCDEPMAEDVKRNTLFISASWSPLFLELHKHNIPLLSCAAYTVWERPLGFTTTHFTTVKKTAAELGFIPVSDGFASAELIARRDAIHTLLRQRPYKHVLALGDYSTWILSGHFGISKWRGSTFPANNGIPANTCTIELQTLNRQTELREFFNADIARFARRCADGTPEIPYTFLLNASFDTYMSWLRDMIAKANAEPVRLTCDIETIRRQVACIGIGTSARDAICIPLRTKDNFWSLDEEVALIRTLQTLLEHPNVWVINQNFHYDAYFLCLKYGIVARCRDDTMVASHVLSPRRPKALDQLASLYCDHYQYWKDELDDYKSAPKDDMQFFRYNCLDCCYTFEVNNALFSEFNAPSNASLLPIYRYRMDRTWWSTLALNIRGCRVNTKDRARLGDELLLAANERQQFLNAVIGREFNANSPVQMKQFFYNEMGVTPAKSRITKKVSLGSEILLKIPDEHPILRPVVNAIIERRSIGVFLSTFIMAPVDGDGRIRSSFKMSHTDTYRYSSSENPFGTGANLQNISKGDRAKTRFKLPNIREFFVPDPGHIIADIDLAGADAQIVAWEADDVTMKTLFREKKKIAAFAAREIFGSAAGSDGKNEPYYTRAKAGGHATNYGAWPKTVSLACGITIHEAEQFQKKWFGVFPGIKSWQDRIRLELQTKREITNRFGYRLKFLGRVDDTHSFAEALAWCPQSSVAIITQLALEWIKDNYPQVAMLLQVHDSLVFQYPSWRGHGFAKKIADECRIVVPYDDPLVIPFGVKTSENNWGECE